MMWISNNDPPLYVWDGDTWYNQKDRITYKCDIHNRTWFVSQNSIPFPKKTHIMT